MLFWGLTERSKSIQEQGTAFLIRKFWCTSIAILTTFYNHDVVCHTLKESRTAHCWKTYKIGLFNFVHFCQHNAKIRSIHTLRIQINFKSALDFDWRVILSFRSPFSTLRFSLKIKSFTKQNMFYRSDILHDFSMSSF